MWMCWRVGGWCGSPGRCRRFGRPGRSGLEGATVRWHGHTNQPEPDTAPSSVNERQMLVSYGVVSSAASPPIQPPRVRDLLVRALWATLRGNKTAENSR